MRKPTSSSKHVIAALVAAAFGLTAGTALAQTSSQSSNTPASHRHASKKSVRQLTSQVKREKEQMQATTGKLNRATAQLNRTTHQMKQARAKEMRVASAEHHVRKTTRRTRSRVHPRRLHHRANTTPPPR